MPVPASSDPKLRALRPDGDVRVALYWCPAADDPLATAGSAWLGRDAELGTAVAQPAIAGLAASTAAPRRYGFHATLRPPMRLATGWAEFIGACHALVRDIAAFPMPTLAVNDMDGFLALREAAPCPALRRLADACVAGTDPHRLRAGAAELARRREAPLTPEQDALLLRWGYPWVMDSWRFHVTLSGRLAPADMARLHPAAAAHFGAALAQPRCVTGITVCTQRDGGPFLAGERLQLTG